MEYHRRAFPRGIIQVNHHPRPFILDQHVRHADEEIKLDRGIIHRREQAGYILVRLGFRAGQVRIGPAPRHFIPLVEREGIFRDTRKAAVRQAIREADAIAQVIGRVAYGRHPEGHIVDRQQRLQYRPPARGHIAAAALQKRIRAEVVCQAIIRSDIEIHGLLQFQIHAGEAGILRRVIGKRGPGKAVLRVQGINRLLGILPEYQRPGPIHGGKAPHGLRQPADEIPPGFHIVSAVDRERFRPVGQRTHLGLRHAQRHSAFGAGIGQQIIGLSLGVAAAVILVKARHVVIGLDHDSGRCPFRLGYGEHPQGNILE